MEMIFMLLAGHALADFSLQSDAMAKGKNRHNKTTPPPNAKYTPCWPYWLTAHALIHGMVVAVITGIWWLGLVETVWHWIIDFMKCDSLIGVHFDQFMHVIVLLAIWASFTQL